MPGDTDNAYVEAAPYKITSPQKCPNGHAGWNGFKVERPYPFGVFPELTHISLNDADPPRAAHVEIRFRPIIDRVTVRCEHMETQGDVCGAEFEIELPELI